MYYFLFIRDVEIRDFIEITAKFLARSPRIGIAAMDSVYLVRSLLINVCDTQAFAAEQLHLLLNMDDRCKLLILYFILLNSTCMIKDYLAIKRLLA